MTPKLPAQKPETSEDLLEAVVELFRQNLKRGPWPNKFHCYYLANDIVAVKNAKAPKALTEDPAYVRRRATITAMERLILERKRYDPFPGLRLPAKAEACLEALQKALDRARPSLMGWVDPWAGERRGAAWHKPARFLARRSRRR